MEITAEMKSTTLHFVLGVLMGFVSAKLGRYNALMIGIALGYVLAKSSKFMFKHSGGKWWMGNGLWPYLTTWIASWTIFLNA